MSGSAPQAPGRRTAGARRVDVTVLLAVLLPLVLGGTAALVRPDRAAEDHHAPRLTALARSTVACPSAIGGARQVAMTSTGQDVRGPVQVGTGRDREQATVRSGAVTTVTADDGPVPVTGEDDTAPGLVAARFGDRQTAAVSCPAPAADVWFTGVGSGAGHTSVVELVNPDAGTAVADITVHGASGVVDAPRLRGVSVPGGSSVRLDLASIVPRRYELAVEVSASRGRIGASVLDRYDLVGATPRTEDWLPAQRRPSRSNLLMGLPPGDGSRTLVLANGGDREVRADLRIVTDRSVFAPEGVKETRVPPGGVVRVPVSEVLGEAIGKGANGVLVTSSGPVTATLRSYVDGDLSHAVPGDTVGGSVSALLPPVGGGADKSVELADARRSGVVTVVARSASGRELASRRAEVGPDRGVSVPLPSAARLVTVTPQRTSVAGAVVVRDRGAAVVPLTLPATNGLVPDVGPGLP